MIKVEPAVLPRFVFIDYGARVALQRCPILRAVKTLSRESTSHALRWRISSSSASHKCF